MSYFNTKYQSLIEKPKIIEDLKKDSQFLIAGNFYGIQKFIFENLSTKNASKVIRSRSAFIEIFTLYMAKYICYYLNIDEERILTTNAGKFEILANDIEIDKLQKIQGEVDSYFIETFFGLSGISLFFVSVGESDFSSKEKYKVLREKIRKKEEEQKYTKFSLVTKNSILEDYDTSITNKTLCKVCNFRKVTQNKRCEVCDGFIHLGEYLVSEKELFSASSLGIDVSFFNNFNPEIELNKKLKSYVKKDGKEIATFENLAQSSCDDEVDGIEALAILKADVDNMGKYLKESSVTESFESFDIFSRTMDNFFSLYIPQQLMSTEFKNTYTVFAGGDDLFLVGAWDEVLGLARKIEKEFKEFVNNSSLSISFGIAIAKPSTPISYLAEHTEHLLEKAKDIDEYKDAITLFGETVKWKAYKESFEELSKLFKMIHPRDMNTAFLYRLLDLSDMAKRTKYKKDDFKIEDTMWKSKLNYSFARNMNKKYYPLLEELNIRLENYPSETRMFLSEFIYKRRSR